MATEISISVPDAHVLKVLEALNGLADKEVTIQCKDEMLGVWSYTYPEKEDAESNRAFATRVFTETLRAFVRMYHHSEDRKRWNTDIESITPVSHNVPDDVIE